MKGKSQMAKILELIDRDGPLSNVRISEISGVPSGTVRCYTSLLSRSGELERFKNLRGIYIITDKGRNALTELQKKEVRKIETSK